MAIINPLPYTITNGTIANADQVQGNDQWIVDQVNANSPGQGYTDLTALGGLLTVGASASDTLLTLSSGSAVNDALSELSYAGATKFTAKNAGTYVFTALVTIYSDPTSVMLDVQQFLNFYKNGSLAAGVAAAAWPFATGTYGPLQISGGYGIQLSAGDYVNFYLQAQWTVAAPQAILQFFTARRMS